VRISIVVALTVLAACGGKPCPEPKPPERVTAAEVAALQDRICDCKDAACVEGFRSELDGLTIGFYQAAALYVAIDECSTGGRAVVAELQALRDRACSCTTSECVGEVYVAYEELLVRHQNTKSSRRQSEQLALLATELAGCVERVAGGAP